MKKPYRNFTLLYVAILMLFTFSAQAQDEAGSDAGSDRVFKPFKIGLGLGTGYAFGGGSNNSVEESGSKKTTKATGIAGFSISYIEPKYAITDNIGVGFRGEWFLIGGGSTEVTEEGGKETSAKGEAEIAGLAVYSLTGDYTFTTTFVRPSVGLGLGLYQQASTGVKASASGDDPASNSASLTKEDKTAFGISPRVSCNFGRAVLGLSYHLTLSDEVYDFYTLNLGFELFGSRY